MKVKKSKYYKVGVCGVRAILEKKDLAVKFENDETVEVTQKQFDTLNALGWCVEVNDDSNTKSSKQGTTNRDTTTVEDK